MHDTYPEASGQEGSGRERACGARQNLERLGERLVDYLRSRTADHWIMFVAGLVAGLLLA